MALGAAPSGVLRLIVSRGFALTGAGIAIGIVTARGTTRLLGDLLYTVSPRDPLSFGVAFALMALASTLACVMPARRAAHADPADALRE